MKKLLAIILAALMLLSLAACGDNNTTDPDKDNPGVSQSGENNDDKGGTEYPIADNGGEDTSGTTEPDNTGNGTENNDVDTWTVENFLKLYGFDAEDLKPNHFTSFEELKMADSKEPGKKGSAGSVIINVEKGKTTTDDFNAWFESLYAKMTELSDDGKLYYSAAKTVEATPLSELQSGVLWADMPGGLCVITTNVDGSAMTISISSRYDVELEQYSISITVMSVA